MFSNSVDKRAEPCSKKRLESRRLAIQQLEARLALSSAPVVGENTVTLDYDASLAGGYVDVSVVNMNQYSLNLSSDWVTHGGVVPNAVYQDSVLSDNSADDLFLQGDSLTNPGFTVRPGSTFSRFEPKVIDLPELFPSDPHSGTIAITPRDPFADPPVGGTAGDEQQAARQSTSFADSISAQSFVEDRLSLSGKREDAATRSVSEGPSNELVPSRDRAVAFRVATVTPPRVISPASTTKSYSPSEANHNNYTSGSRSSEVSELSERARTESSKTSFIQARSADEMSESIEADVGLPTNPKSQHQSLQSNSELHYHGQDDQSARHKPTAAISAEESEQEAREHVFAEWRSRDLVAMPAVVALTAGPLLFRRRNTQGDTLQVPPGNS